MRNYLSRGTKYTGVGKIVKKIRFRQKPPFISDTIQDMTLSDIERRNTRGQNFLADLRNYARTV